jgi:hypothetical protein
MQEKISKGVVVTDHESQNSMSALENSRPPWCPLGLLKTQKHKLQRAHSKKLKQEGLANMGEQIFNKTDPIFPQSSKVG